MNKTWLVVANRAEAKIFHINKKECDLITAFSHPEGHMFNKDLISDRPGHYKAPDTSRGAFVPDTPHHTVEDMHFSQQIANFLEHEYANNQFQKLIICAEPHFYGMLTGTFSSHLAATIKHHVLKDFIPLDQSSDFNQALEKIQNEFIF